MSVVERPSARRHTRTAAPSFIDSMPPPRCDRLASMCSRAHFSRSNEGSFGSMSRLDTGTPMARAMETISSAVGKISPRSILARRVYVTSTLPSNARRVS